MKKSLLVVSLFIGATLLVWGCMGKNGAPISPTRVISLSVTASNINGVRAKLLGTTQNVILYRIDGTSGAPVTGSVGPFSASGNSGSYTFVIPNFVSSGNSLLSLQLNDANNGQVLAIGAAPVVSTSGVPIVNVELGSLLRTCYDINGANFPLGYAFGFSADNIDSNNAGTDTGNGLDIAFGPGIGNGSGQFAFQDASSSGVTFEDIAYLGNGNLVDFDKVPPDSSFYVRSIDAKAGGIVVSELPSVKASGLKAKGIHSQIVPSTAFNLAVGDIYCVKLSTIPGAHAWIQITDAGLLNSSGPSFIFRENDSTPYYAYEQTAFDTQGGCSTSGVTVSGPASISAFMIRQTDSAATTVEAEALIDVNGVGQSGDAVSLNAPGGPVQLPSLGAGLYSASSFTYTPGFNYTLTAASSSTTINTSVAAPGGINYNADGSSVTVTDTGSYDVAQVVETSGPNTSANYATIGLPLPTILALPNTAFPDFGATYTETYTAATTVTSFSGTGTTATGVFYAYDQDVQIISPCSSVIGSFTSGSGSNTFEPGTMWLEPVTTTGSVTLTGMNFNSPDGGNYEIGIYSDNTGVPLNLLAHTQPVSTGNGGNLAAPLTSSIVLAPSTAYWFGVHADSMNLGSFLGTSDNYPLANGAVYGSLPTSLAPVSVSAPVSFLTYANGLYCP
jgi:hypothetical protein